MISQEKWTSDQRNAIFATGGSVLVSAAAGSGKTAVLTERVINMISRDDNPIDADRLLIVTFTNAASVEMRERISSRINELLAINPTDRNLQRQNILLTKAPISTIHSFCSDLLREYFYKLDISSSFRIADENEMSAIRDEAIDNVLEKQYQIGDKDFLLAVENFSSTKDDLHLVEIIKLIYNFICSHPYPDLWMKRNLGLYENFNSMEKSIWGKVILEYAKDTINFCISLVNKSIEILNDDEKLYNAFYPVLNDERDSLKLIDTSSWDKSRTGIKAMTFARLNTPRGYKDNPLKAIVSDNRKKIKDSIQKLCKLFALDSKGCKEDLKLLCKNLKVLFNLVTEFSCELRRLKSEKNILDFSDLENLTVKLLTSPSEDGFEKTKEAIEISKRFDYIMVDEYQDTNETQDLIFRALSNDEKNLFVVGDVKQSIYGFRQAMPEIFLRKKESYKKYNPELDRYPAKIVLGNNFRSRRGVTEAVNFFFRQLMCKKSGEIGYDTEDELIAKATYNERTEKDTEIYLIDLKNSFSQDMDVVEAKCIADVINEKVKSGYKVKDGQTTRELKYSDCCVLLRSTKNHASLLVKELEKNGIPAWSESSDSFFSAIEIQFMLSLLKVIDNPIQDIPLLSLLMSPFYMVSVDEIAKIRSAKKDVPFYFALKEYISSEENEKLKNVLEQIDHYRTVCLTISCSQFINYIYENTDILSLVQTMKGGEKRLLNLRMLVEHAKKYEASGFKSVSDFIKFISRLQEQKSDLQSPSIVSESSNAVKVMSIHRSKGLEFSVCIIANGSRKFNKEKNDVLLHTDLGVGIKIKDKERLCMYTNFVRESALLEIERSEMSEELRILYVAMTRAKENLIMLCSLKDVEKSLHSFALQVDCNETFEKHVVRSAQSFSDWIIMCALKHPDGRHLRELAGIPNDAFINCECGFNIKVLSVKQNSTDINSSISREKTPICGVDKTLLRKMKERFEYKYSLDGLSGIPAKISVSEISHGIFDGSKEIVLSGPSFLKGSDASSTDRGIAIHAFLQFADFKAARKSLDSHIDYLVSRNFLTQEQSLLINRRQINNFLHSPLAERIIAGKSVIREFRFNINLKAKELNENLDNNYDDEYVVLQGAIDCVLCEEDKFLIVDYKTDRVSTIEELVEKYYKQLSLYKAALKECVKRENVSCMIYSFHLGITSNEF